MQHQRLLAAGGGEVPRCVPGESIGLGAHAEPFVDHRLTPTGELDPTDEIRVSCTPAGHPYTVITAAFLARDAVRTCRCGTTFPCPAEADEVVCPACRLHQPGPFLGADPGRRDYVARVHADYMDGVRARLRRLRDEP